MLELLIAILSKKARLAEIIKGNKQKVLFEMPCRDKIYVNITCQYLQAFSVSESDNSKSEVKTSASSRPTEHQASKQKIRHNTTENKHNATQT